MMGSRIVFAALWGVLITAALVAATGPAAARESGTGGQLRGNRQGASQPAAIGPEFGPIQVADFLVLDRVSSGGRTAIFTDTIEHTLVRGKWRTPAAGVEVVTPAGETKTWRTLSADEDGWYVDEALRGGYAYARIQSARDQVALLSVVGPRHLYWNGRPRAGDPYQLGFVKIPVRLVKGKNELLMKAGRGRLKFSVEAPPALAFIASEDRTLPDVVRGEAGPLQVGVLVSNVRRSALRGSRITATNGDGTSLTTSLPVIAPLSSRKVRVLVPVPPKVGQTLAVTLELTASDLDHASQDSFELRVREPGEWHRRTLVSEIDGSVQYYGVVPPVAQAGRSGLVLSLHGAGVEGGRQASCYEPKKWAYVIAPTNRRPFGFDWEDWGRIDAMEVLADAERRLNTDPRQVHVTGHSMGGHGAWQLGAHFPDRFGAVAPSAGWRDFWAYGAPALEVTNGVEATFWRASSASRTLLLEQNYRMSGVYILHGDDDKVVPVEQARFMRKRLQDFHDNLQYHEQPGAGHWWGNECMDWSPLFAFLRKNPLPEAKDVKQFAFTTVSPAISSRCFWATVETQRQWLQPSRIALSIDALTKGTAAATVVGETVNVSRLVVDLAPFEWYRKPRVEFRIDAQAFDCPWPEDGKIPLQRTHGVWRPAGPPSLRDKHPLRAGPFKEAFRNRVVLVYGTSGTGAETAWAFAKARYDAETFWYRGNGAMELIPDVEFAPAHYRDRNVILYGNADTNRAWSLLLPKSPVQVSRGVVKVGKRSFKGDDLAAVFVYPRPDSTSASVGVVAGSGLPGMRLTHQLPYFVSGAGFPDWAVYDVEALRAGSRGIHGAGFFDTDWSLGAGSRWRE